jgi:hypothetical protein
VLVYLGIQEHLAFPGILACLVIPDQGIQEYPAIPASLVIPDQGIQEYLAIPASPVIPGILGLGIREFQVILDTLVFLVIQVNPGIQENLAIPDQGIQEHPVIPASLVIPGILGLGILVNLAILGYQVIPDILVFLVIQVNPGIPGNLDILGYQAILDILVFPGILEDPGIVEPRLQT